MEQKAAEQEQGDALASRTVERFTLLVPLGIYCLVGGIQAYRLRDALNPDGVSYLRNAELIVDGHYFQAVSGYWSPLLSWLMALPIALGLDTAYSGRLVMFMCGACLVLSCHFLLRVLSPDGNKLAHVAATSLIAVVAARNTSLLTPDLLLPALLIGYFSLLFCPSLNDSTRFTLIGLLCGLAYLTKSYALPFLTLHLPISVFLVRCGRGGAMSGRRVSTVFRYLLCSLAAFAVVAGGWIALLSVKYQRPTFSTVASAAHTIIGPDDVDRSHPWSRCMVEVAEGRLNSWETPNILPYNSWSPLESREYFLHQVNYGIESANQILKDISAFDVLRIVIPMICLSPVIFLMQPRWDRMTLISVWTFITFSIYASGFLLVYYEVRYLEALFLPLAIVFSATVGRSLVTRFVSDNHRRLGTAIWVAVMVCSFGLAEAHRWKENSGATIAEQGRISRNLAVQLSKTEADAKIASHKSVAGEALYISFYSGQPFVGVPLPERGLLQQLDEFQVTHFVADASHDYSELLGSCQHWQCSASAGTIKVFARRD